MAEPVNFVKDTSQREGERERAGFLESAFSAATTELIGGDASLPILRYRSENPGAGFASQALGMAPFFVTPLTGRGLKILGKVPGLGRGITRGQQLIDEGRPFLGMMSRDVTAIGMAEAGRLATTAAVHGPGSEEAGTVAREAVFDLAITGALSGIIGHFQKSLPPVSPATDFETQITRTLDPDFNLNAPPQIKMQRMEKIVERTESEAIRREAQRHIRRYGKAVREQDTPGKISVVRRIGSEEAEEQRLASQLSARFKVKDTRDQSVRKLLDSRQKGGFAKKGETRKFLEQADLHGQWEKHTFLPRALKVKTKRAAKETEKMLNRMSTPVMSNGRRMWIAREADDGPFVMVKRIQQKEGRVEPGDEFVLFKTDNPEFFEPELSQFGKLLSDEAFRVKTFQQTRKPDGSMTRFVRDLQDSLPSVGVMSGEMVQSTSTRQAAERITRGLIGDQRLAEMKQFMSKAGATGDYLGRIAREAILPSINRYGGKNGSARAASISLTMKAIADRARFNSTQILAGQADRTYKNSIFKDIFTKGTPREGGLYPLVDNLPDEALPDISKARNLAMSVAEMEQEGMNREAINFMKRLWRADRNQLGDVNANMRDIDYPEFDGLENHYMLSRMWDGPFRLPVLNKRGRVVAVAGGRAQKHVKDEAERLAEVINKEGSVPGGVTVDAKGIKYADEGDDLQQAVDIGGSRDAARAIDWLRKARDPKRFKDRTGVRGFIGESKDLSHKDLRQLLGKQVRELQNLVGRRVAEKTLFDDIAKLESENPAMARMIRAEFRSRFGERGEWTKATEDFVDRILTPVLGVRASEVVRNVNSAIFQLTLGMGNIGFAALNAVTFLQTTLPEIAWLLHTPPSRVRDMYGHAFVKTADGMAQVSYVEPLKFVYKAWGDLHNPSDELFGIYRRAVDEGRVSPVLAEEVFGPDSRLISHLKGLWQGRRTFPETVLEASSWMPARTEEMSRAMAMAMGWRMGKNFMKLEGEDLYQFTTRFVDNTHFRYSSADRPLLLRGAFGSLVGLFKSWMLHYIGNMTRYAGDGIRHGNWGPLMWSQAGTFSVAGLSGSSILPVAEGLNDLLSDDPMVQNLYEKMGWQDTKDFNFVGTPADAIWFGLPAFLNLSLSHRAAVPGADVPNDIEQLYSIMHWDRAVAIGDLVGSSFDAWQATGEHPARSQEVRDALYRAFLPRTAQAVMQTVGERGTRSLRTQNTVLSETTWLENTLNAAGFQPNRLARAYQAMDILFERQQDQFESIAAFGEMYAQARADNDFRGMLSILRRATEAGLPIDSVRASADARLGKRDEGLLERQFDDQSSRALLRALGK